MKTSIIIKETKQTLANNPIKYGEYVDNLVTALTKADRMGNIELGRIFAEARNKIELGEWTDVDNFKQFVETYIEMSNSRATQILKGYDVYTALLDYYYEKYNSGFVIPPEEYTESEEINTAFIELLTTYTITHFYELKNLEPHDIETLAFEGTIKPDMSVKELKKALADWLKADEDDSEGEGDGDKGTDGNDSNEETPEIYVRNADEAELLYKTILGMLNEGKTLKVNLSDLA